jgi:hypothetical protein
VKCRPLLSGFTRGCHSRLGLARSDQSVDDRCAAASSSLCMRQMAADHKVIDPLRSAINSALASSLLTDLSAIVVDYARPIMSIGTVRRVSTRRFSQ